MPSNFQLGDRELRRAIELSPSLALAHGYLGFSLVRQGRLDESLQEMLKARKLDPLSPIIARQAAMPYYLKRNYSQALELLRQASQGLPRQASRILRVAMQLAAQKKLAHLPDDLLQQAITELR